MQHSVILLCLAGRTDMWQAWGGRGGKRLSLADSQSLSAQRWYLTKHQDHHVIQDFRLIQKMRKGIACLYFQILSASFCIADVPGNRKKKLLQVLTLNHTPMPFYRQRICIHWQIKPLCTEMRSMQRTVWIVTENTETQSGLPLPRGRQIVTQHGASSLCGSVSQTPTATPNGGLSRFRAVRLRTQRKTLWHIYKASW